MYSCDHYNPKVCERLYGRLVSRIYFQSNFAARISLGMESIISFITAHWVLSTLFVLCFVAFVLNECLSGSFGVTLVSPEELVRWMDHQNAVVIDIRDSERYAEGHILGGRNMPIATLEKKMASLKPYKEQPLVITCITGRGASKVAAVLKKQGFQVAVLQGGIQGWLAAGLPLTKK